MRVRKTAVASRLGRLRRGGRECHFPVAKVLASSVMSPN